MITLDEIEYTTIEHYALAESNIHIFYKACTWFGHLECSDMSKSGIKNTLDCYNEYILISWRC